MVCRDGFDKLRIHRLVGRCASNPARFITRGDNQSAGDPPREVDQVLGRVVVVERSWARRLLRVTDKLAAGWLQPSPARL